MNGIQNLYYFTLPLLVESKGYMDHKRNCNMHYRFHAQHFLCDFQGHKLCYLKDWVKLLHISCDAIIPFGDYTRQTKLLIIDSSKLLPYIYETL